MPSFKDIIGRSHSIKDAIALAKRASETNIAVLLEGESGVGKELFAQAIHENSNRADGAFVAVNCGAIPENLVESILFGHEKGSFTGAVNKTLGKFREADGGTLFLDEVGELKPDVQVKLLRALQEKEVQPVGGTEAIPVNIRVISATNRNLYNEVQGGGFREDLYYRLHVLPILIPPLRERQQDIRELFEYFYAMFSKEEMKAVKQVDEKLLNELVEYSWPGNVRQLKNAIHRAIVLCDDAMLTIEDFQHIIPLVATENRQIDKVRSVEDCIRSKYVSLLDNHGGVRLLEDLERDIIELAMCYYEGRISKVAEGLGIGRSTLYRKLEKFSLLEDKMYSNILQ